MLAIYPTSWLPYIQCDRIVFLERTGYLLLALAGFVGSMHCISPRPTEFNGWESARAF